MLCTMLNIVESTRTLFYMDKISDIFCLQHVSDHRWNSIKQHLPPTCVCLMDCAFIMNVLHIGWIIWRYPWCELMYLIRDDSSEIKYIYIYLHKQSCLWTRALCGLGRLFCKHVIYTYKIFIDVLFLRIN